MAACKLAGDFEEQIGDGAAMSLIKYRNFDGTVAMDTPLIYRTTTLYSKQELSEDWWHVIVIRSLGIQRERHRQRGCMDKLLVYPATRTIINLVVFPFVDLSEHTGKRAVSGFVNILGICCVSSKKQKSRQDASRSVMIAGSIFLP